MKRPRDYVSHSFLRTLQRCGMQAKFRYEDGLVVPPGIRMVRGDAVDASVTKNMRTKRDTRETLSLEEIAATTSDAMDLKVAGGISLTEEEEERGAQKVIGEAKDEAISLAKLHAEVLAPKIEPDIVQAEIKSAKPIDVLNGKKLMVVVDLTSKSGVIHDTKTSTKSKNQREADASPQLSIYSFGYYLAKGELPSAVRLDTLVAQKSGPKAQELISARDWPQINSTLEAMGRAQKMFEAGIFLPTNPENWWCLSMDTEVLTFDGARKSWKTYQNLSWDDQILTINPHSMLLEWQHYTHAFVKKHEERRMISYVGRGVRYCVTPDHDMLVRSVGRGKWRWTKADALEGKGSVAYPVASVLPRHAKQLSDDWLALSGWLCSEGSFREDGAINIYQRFDSRGFTKIQDILLRLEVPFSVYGNGDGVRAFYIGTAPSATIRADLQSTKMIPSWLWDVDARQFRIWLDAMIDGDGSRYGGTTVLSQRDEAFIDELQALALTHRFSAAKKNTSSTSSTGGTFSTLSLLDGITERLPEPAGAQKHFLKDAYAEEVWCLSVPNQTMVTRYMGRPLIVGNCSRKWCGYARMCPFYVKEAEAGK